jgi:hypothetical protein
MSKEEINVYRVLAPKGWTANRVTGYLRVDPYQMRTSRYLIPLTHPRTGKTLPLKEFVDDMIGDSRFCIETTDAFVFVSRVQNSAFGTIFIPVAQLPKDVLDKQEKEDKLPKIYS